MPKKNLDILFKRKLNALVLSDQDIAEEARLLGYGLVEVILQEDDLSKDIESVIGEEMAFCRSEGYSLIVRGAEHLSGICMYRIWEALTTCEGYDPDFHIVLCAGRNINPNQIDKVLRNQLAVLTADGTFYREPEHV